MPSFGVNIVIFLAGRVLLMQREDFEVWCLPGGGVELCETVAQAARREAQEETGLQVTLTRLVGVYSRPRPGAPTEHVVVFAAQAVGGELRPQVGEAIALQTFDPADLPEDLVPWHRQRILDAVAGRGGGVAWWHDRHWPFPPGVDWREVQRLCAEEMTANPALSRADFYRRWLAQPGAHGDEDELRQPPNGRADAGEAAFEQQGGDSRAPDLGANVAIFDHGRVLLTRRQDYDVWCLPGGHVEEGETIAESARRETMEEVGLQVRLRRLTGVYSEPRWYHRGLHVFSFIGEVSAGELRLQTEEVAEARFFGPDELPEDLLFGHLPRLQHAFARIGGAVVWRQPGFWNLPAGLSRQQIYALRDRSGLSRRQFYFKYLGEYDAAAQVLEVEGEHAEVG